MPRCAIFAFGVAATAFCACRRATPPQPVVEVVLPEPPRTIVSPWDGTIDAVRAALDSGRYAHADSLLASFATLYPGTVEADESTFWRALLRTDPANSTSTTADGINALDAYLATERAPRRIEAVVLRRLLAITDSLRTAQAQARAATEQRDKTRDEELNRLKEELQRTQAELERIKRRLGTPRP